jgi:hypothetical protein
MEETVNRFGLSRAIPSEVRREVRRRCGFGCVVCGSAIYDYEHYSPEFKDSDVHHAEGIALLCPTDHRKKNNGLLSEEDYLRHIKAPAAISKGFSHTEWSVDSFAPEILCGSLTFSAGASILQIGDELLLGFGPPEAQGAPPCLLFRVFDRRGVEVFGLVGNEIQCQNDAFDIEAVGPIWSVRSALRKIDLEIRFDPPTRITIKRLHFSHLNWELAVKNSSFSLLFNGNPVNSITGPAKVRGSCLYVLKKNQPHVDTSNLVIAFGGGPSPIGTKPNDNGDGFSIIWPLFCLVYKDNSKVKIEDYNEQKTLCLYTRKSFAEVAGQETLQIQTLSYDQCRTLVSKLGMDNLIKAVAFNIDPTQPTTSYTWAEFLESFR